MDYKKIYESIVSSNIECDGYTENHHIIPKCLGGSNDKSNIIKISYRKHFLCHWLLCKIYPENFKLKAAFCKMVECGKNKKRIVSSREFDIVKRIVKDVHYPWLKSWQEQNEPWNKGKKGLQTAWNKGLKTGPASDERKHKTSETMKKRYENVEHHRKGKSPWCAGTKGEGVVKAWNKGIPAVKEQCPHCLRFIDKLNLIKWHGDKCKQKAA